MAPGRRAMKGKVQHYFWCRVQSLTVYKGIYLKIEAGFIAEHHMMSICWQSCDTTLVDSADVAWLKANVSKACEHNPTTTKCHEIVEATTSGLRKKL
ncbi:hypothetical protein TNCV_4718391 [Trichonephila clavipes]|nr:hypothetical protein TNCV_4718391 [Trichonephila clavipes]